ncbi:MAG: hypothetical protein ACLP7I_08420 [Limisphaerales bacterium]
MRLLLVILCVLMQAPADAQLFENYLSGYAPLLDGHAWPRLAVLAYTNVAGVWVHSTKPQDFPKVKLDSIKDADFTIITLQCPDGRTFKSYCDAALSAFAVEVYSGDFNGDGIPDFLMVKPGSGCGLAAQYCTGVFAFSNGKDYQFTRIRTMGLGPHDLVLDPATKSFRLIHTSFLSAMSTDSRSHSYWVHRFYEWNGTSFRLDPKLSPVWIQFLTRTNHEPTKLLTSEAKVEAWTQDTSIEW